MSLLHFKSALFVSLSILSPVLSGCSSQPSRIQQAKVDSPAVATSICSDYDKDGNGTLNPKEIKALAAIANRFKAYDLDANGELSPEEITKRFESEIFHPKKALIEVSCVVLQNKRPLSNATVKLIPLDYFKDQIPKAEGITDRKGIVRLSIKEADLPENAPKLKGFMRPGLYRAEITHPSKKIAPKFNTKSILSIEVSSSALASGSIPLRINSGK